MSEEENIQEEMPEENKREESSAKLFFPINKEIGGKEMIINIFNFQFLIFNY